MTLPRPHRREARGLGAVDVTTKTLTERAEAMANEIDCIRHVCALFPGPVPLAPRFVAQIEKLIRELLASLAKENKNDQH